MTPPTIQQPASQLLVEGISTLYGISWEEFKTIDATLNATWTIQTNTTQQQT